MKITYTDVKPVVEALKEFGRIALLAVIPMLIDQLSSGVIQWKAILVVGAIAVLKAVDKFIHLKGKVEDNATLTRGLTQF
jgi:hypothetical protein